jgi:hypothetical protein
MEDKMKFNLAVAILFATCGITHAKDFKETAHGITDFDTPSLNMCCAYVPTKDTGPLLSCSRVQPKYWTVNLEASGKMTVYKNPGEVPGCGYGKPVGNVLGYGETWSAGGFSCTSAKTGLTCTHNGKGFVLSRKGLKDIK